MRTNQEIVDETNAVAREFYALLGYTVRDGYRFDQATHPQVRQVWGMAVRAQDMLRKCFLWAL